MIRKRVEIRMRVDIRTNREINPEPERQTQTLWDTRLVKQCRLCWISASGVGLPTELVERIMPSFAYTEGCVAHESVSLGSATDESASAAAPVTAAADSAVDGASETGDGPGDDCSALEGQGFGGGDDAGDGGAGNAAAGTVGPAAAADISSGLEYVFVLLCAVLAAAPRLPLLRLQFLTDCSGAGVLCARGGSSTMKRCVSFG